MTLLETYAAVVCDLDGVVYRGPTPVPHAVESLSRADVPVLFATNNASRAPGEVAVSLTAMGLPADATAVATSSQAGAWVLEDRLNPGDAVLPVGGPGVADALQERRLRLVRPATGDGEPAAVLQGYGALVTATDLAEAAYAIQSGALWVATNTDATLPTDRGLAPGNGALVGAVRAAVGREPDLVAGKPHPPLYLLCAERLGMPAASVLAVGDRLETDVEGAVRTGMDSVLVLTGVHGLADALEAPPPRRPTYVLPDLRWLLRPLTGPIAAVQEALSAAHDDLDAGRLNRATRSDRLAGLQRLLDAAAHE